jgi:arsenate reductase
MASSLLPEGACSKPENDLASARDLAILRFLSREDVMSVTIYHNPNCSTSRKVLGWLSEKGIEPEIVQYLKTPPSATELKRILKLMGGAKAADILRRKGEAYETLGDVAKMKNDELIAAMVKEPVLIERPIVITDKAAVLCRPPEKVWEVVKV